MLSSELKGFSDIGESVLDDQLRANIIYFFDWGFLNKGAFTNVNIPASGQYGGEKDKLKLVKDPRFNNGQVWQGFRNNWVWESGLSTSTQPIQISGVYVNGVFYPSTTTGSYSHYIDYPRGRIIFNNAISTTATVKAEYSYKTIKVVDANEVPFIRELQSDSFRLESGFTSVDSGNYSVLVDNKLQLPVLAVEVTSDIQYKPYALGGGQYTRTKTICHILGDDEKFVKKISFIVSNQNEKCINTFDVNQIVNNQKAPLTYKGSIASGALTYPQMVNNYSWRKLSFTDMSSQDGGWLGTIYHSPVSFRAEVVVNNI